MNEVLPLDCASISASFGVVVPLELNESNWAELKTYKYRLPEALKDTCTSVPVFRYADSSV